MTPLALNQPRPPIARFGGWIQTYMGKAYYPCDPHPSEVDIYDIAHALSMLCRYGGHSERFYSVAEHSVLVSFMVPEEHALAALLHDATEAYLVDVPRPVKQMLEDYIGFEHLNHLAIARRFHLPDVPDPSIKQADTDILFIERKRLMRDDAGLPNDWPQSVADHKVVHAGLPFGLEISCDLPTVAEMTFLRRFDSLTNKGYPA